MASKFGEMAGEIVSVLSTSIFCYSLQGLRVRLLLPFSCRAPVLRAPAAGSETVREARLSEMGERVRFSETRNAI